MNAELELLSVKEQFEAFGYIFIEHKDHREVRYQPSPDSIMPYPHPPVTVEQMQVDP